MTKSELVDIIAESHGEITRREAEVVVNTIFAAIGDALSSGDRVELRGAGLRAQEADATLVRESARVFGEEAVLGRGTRQPSDGAADGRGLARIAEPNGHARLVCLRALPPASPPGLSLKKWDSKK